LGIHESLGLCWVSTKVLTGGLQLPTALGYCLAGIDAALNQVWIC